MYSLQSLWTRPAFGVNLTPDLSLLTHNWCVTPQVSAVRWWKTRARATFNAKMAAAVSMASVCVRPATQV